MKKKIGLLFAMTVFCFYGQQTYAMHFAKSAMRGIWNNKIVLAGSAIAVDCGRDFHRDWESERESFEELYKNEKSILEKATEASSEKPLNDAREYVEARCKRKGLKTIFLTGDFVEIAGVKRVKDIAVIGINQAAIQNFIQDGLTENNVRAIFAHEYGHIENRDYEKMIALDHFGSLIHFSFAVPFYKFFDMCSKRIADPKKKIVVQLVALGCARSIFQYSKTNQRLLEVNFSRLSEKRADNAVFLTEDVHLITAHKETCMFFKERYPEKQRPWYERGYPTFDERIAACDKALAELKKELKK